LKVNKLQVEQHTTVGSIFSRHARLVRWVRWYKLSPEQHKINNGLQ